jgi:hypothetical protein
MEFVQRNYCNRKVIEVTMHVKIEIEVTVCEG